MSRQTKHYKILHGDGDDDCDTINIKTQKPYTFSATSSKNGMLKAMQHGKLFFSAFLKRRATCENERKPVKRRNNGIS